MKSTKSITPTIGKLATKQDEKFIATGIKELDELIGGGLPRGRITELWGQEGVGKTHLVSQLMVNLSKDHTILFVDSEFALNKNRVAAMGVNMENVDYIADSYLERVCELMVASVGKYDLIILDSLAYLTPLTVDTNEIGETSIGLFARLIKHWIVKFRPRLGISQTAFVAVNQSRARIGMYAKDEPPGGRAWGHAVDIRILLSRNESSKIVDGSRRTGHWLSLEVKKSKISPPYRTTKIKVEY